MNNPTLTIPQHRFVMLPHKFCAFVAGYGCVHPDTKIHTEHGLMRIADINKPTRVLSWDENAGEFVFAWTGGSFVKQIGDSIIVKLGEKVISGARNHAILCHGKWKTLESIENKDELSTIYIPNDFSNIKRQDISNKTLVSIRELAEMSRATFKKILDWSGVERQEIEQYCNDRRIDDGVYLEYWGCHEHYDMQVLETSNYVDEHGFIHHNSGKSWVGCTKLVKHAAEHPGIAQGFFSPSYTSIRDVFYPTIDEVAYNMGFDVNIKIGDREVELYYGRKLYSLIRCRSMDNPSSIVGFKIGNALVDELDTLSTQKAGEAWAKIIARMRYKNPELKNGIDVTTTPEGYKFVYEHFYQKVLTKYGKLNHPDSLYGMVRCSTKDNAKNLNSDYISSLMDSYDKELVRAYINGEFVNLGKGTVYRAFDRKENHTDQKLGDLDRQGYKEPIYVGMDFNVTKMAAVIHVKRQGGPVAVAELYKLLDTPAMIDKLLSLYGDREIYVYPDSSGKNRSTVNADTTDLQQLRKAGFKVMVDNKNPPVRNRVNAMNAAFCNAIGERMYRVNTKLCPEYTRCLEQQAYTITGEPDKTKDTDHMNDAAGYFIARDYAIVRPVAKTNIGMAY